jgi:hypothetical protein
VDEEEKRADWLGKLHGKAARRSRLGKTGSAKLPGEAARQSRLGKTAWQSWLSKAGLAENQPSK